MGVGTEVKSKFKLADTEVKRLILESQNGDNEARQSLVNHNLRLVWSVVQRFMNRGYEADDLFQIGCIGLLKSVDKFDLSYDVKFSTYAVPMIIGEIQRFLRDDGIVKVSRSLKETAGKIRRAKDHLSKVNNSMPTTGDIAKYLGIEYEDVILAQEANRMPASIDEAIYENDGDPITLMDQLADLKDASWFDKVALREAIEQLSDREKLIINLRYFKDQTQAEVAERLSVSQVQISRLEKKLLDRIKANMNQEA